ncbi:hypothetical protein ACHWQZ_G018802 [Mnemiopsis leidyi]
MFLFVQLFLLLIGCAMAKQPCPICQEWTSLRTGETSSYIYRSCSEAIQYEYNSRCREGKSCKMVNAEIEDSLVREIKCVDSSASACSSKFPGYSCKESYVFQPDKCPSCMVFEAHLEGQPTHVESSCSNDTTQWTTCARGTSCNLLDLSGRIENDHSENIGSTKINMMGCGLGWLDCYTLERNYADSRSGIKITSCISKDFGENSVSNRVYKD